jgi:ribosomal protein L22
MASSTGGTSSGSVSSLLDAVVGEAEKKAVAAQTEETKAQKKELPIFSTGNFKGSPRKVQHLSRIIAGMSLADAQLQMKMNLKRPAAKIQSLLTRVTATLKHNYDLDPKRFFISQAWVGKGHYRKAVNFHGRGRFGIMHHPSAHVKIVLGERNPEPTREESQLLELVRLIRKEKKPLNNLREHYRPPQVLAWNAKPWKYITSPKWIGPENAAKRELKRF